MTLHSSYLPSTSPHVLKTLTYFRQATTSQLRRLHYDGTPKGQLVRSSRHLKRLTALGLVRRVWGVYGGAPEYVYMPPDSKARTGDMHTLDITELYVRLFEKVSINFDKSWIFDPEPWCHVNVGHMVLKPDSYIDLGQMRYFLEMDRGTEFRSALAQKMRRYIAAYENWPEPVFPQVLFVCHDSDRLRFIQQVIRSQTEPKLFQACLFSDFLNHVEGRK